jgi:uncharacterized membrane protein
VFALFAFATQDSIIKLLSERYSVIEILMIRLAIVLALLLAVGLAWQGPGILRTRRPRLMFARGVLAFFAFTTYYIALSSIPLAEAAVVYMTAPLFVTLLSALILRERVGLHRWSAIVIGFGAVVFMLDPGSSLFRIESAMPLFSALCYALIPIINRHIGLSEHALTMGIYTTASYFVLMGGDYRATPACHRQCDTAGRVPGLGDTASHGLVAAVTRRCDFHGGAALHHPGLSHRRRQHGGAVRVCLYSLGQFDRLLDVCGCSRPPGDDWRGGYRDQRLLHHFAGAGAAWAACGGCGRYGGLAGMTKKSGG